MFGFEIGRPAYPKTSDWKKLVLMKSDVQALFQKLDSTNEGIIVWSAFKDITDVDPS